MTRRKRSEGDAEAGDQEAEEFQLPALEDGRLKEDRIVRQEMVVVPEASPFQTRGASQFTKEQLTSMEKSQRGAALLLGQKSVTESRPIQVQFHEKCRCFRGGQAANGTKTFFPMVLRHAALRVLRDPLVYALASARHSAWHTSSGRRRRHP